MTGSKMPVYLLCALLLVVGSRNSLGFPVPDSDESWIDSVKNAFNKAKDTAKSGFESASDKISEIGQDIKKSDTYGKVSEQFQDVGDKISKAGDSIKDSDAFKNVRDSINKGVENIKDKFDD